MGHKGKQTPATSVNDNDKKIIAMLSALEDEDKLSQWEKDFVANISETFIGKGWTLSPNQFDKLETIYRKF